MKKNCVICKKEFESNRKRQVCCGKECSKILSNKRDKKYYNDIKKTYKKICIWCGKEFITTKSYQKKCSQICADKFEAKRLKEAGYYKKKIKEEHICKICGKKFITNMSYKFTCSNVCQKNYKKQYQDSWALKNKKYINQKLRIKNKFRYYNDFDYKMKVMLSAGVRNRIAKYGYNKKSKFYELLGCTYEQFIQYIEKQFKPGMNWDNHSLKGWHLDHKIPLVSFDLSKKEEQLKAFHYTNYQPLWWYENLSKGTKTHQNI